jgi:DNA-binding HxlR family transcriptional regulator
MHQFKIQDREYPCPIRLALSVVGGKWKSLIIHILLQSKEPLRYGELRREIAKLSDEATDRMIIQSLKELEADNMITRKAYPVLPPKVEYSLTPSGERLQPIIDALGQFGFTYIMKK